MSEQPKNLPEAEVIVDSAPSTGRFNMAMDAALLELGAVCDRSVVRIYQWSEPTVTLGYFQNGATSEESPFPQLPCVRRLTGGGAILHDREVTYSCVVPSLHRASQNPSELYEIVHRAIIDVLTRCGAESCLRQEFSPPPGATASRSALMTPSLAEPFLCFLRSNSNDILHSSGIKIVGSAQRRRRGVTLQHGSILLAASSMTPALPGLCELSPSFKQARFQTDLPAAIAGSLSDRWKFRDYSAQELEMADSLTE